MAKRHLYLGQSATDLVGSLVNSSNSEVIIRSQFTPEIRINLASLLLGKGKEETFKSDGGNLALQLIKPEIIVRSLGVEKSLAPYGRPEQNYAAVLVASLLGAAALGGAVAFYICKK